ncbi:ComF family protein [Larkinella punicea]|uniref:ComF family protein n=1 Tax=Larkinella punicea TaxID=2315727 RepID=A0A368JNC2_9BACT|nr:ComF family protein [Larkinella punicea]
MQSQEQLVCTTCRLKLPETGQHRGEALVSGQLRFAGKVPVNFVYSYLYFNKKGKTQRLIHALKYRNTKEVGSLLGRWYGYQLKTDIQLNEQIDLIVGVPLHPAKLRQRGYNQSDWFAQGLSETLEIPWSDRALVRNLYTISQTGKDRIERWQNVNNVFGIGDPDLVANKRILLVDDVLTTGATLEACTATLLAANSQSVGIVTIAATR